MLRDRRFSGFIEKLEVLVREAPEPADLVSRVAFLLQPLVGDGGWLEEKYRRPIPDKAYAQYLLHRPEDHAFSVVSFVWNPGQGSPVHDHGTWGVIGQLVGEEEETRFRRLDGRSPAEQVRLEPSQVAVAHPGDLSHVYPPDRDIHRIWNHSASPTLSIHVYGGDIGSRRRHIYDLATGRVLPFVSGYDEVFRS